MELTITKIEKIKRGMCRVWINDEPALRLSEKECEKRGIREEAVLTPETLAAIHVEVLLPMAKKRCLDILLRADQSRKAVHDKLAADEYPEDIIELALRYAESFHYIDDRRYAMNLIALQKEKKSPREITAKLREKGISDEIIREALEESGPADTGELIRTLARKKGYAADDADQSGRDRIYRYLIRKGFSYGEIVRALSENILT